MFVYYRLFVYIQKELISSIQDNNTYILLDLNEYLKKKKYDIIMILIILHLWIINILIVCLLYAYPIKKRNEMSKCHKTNKNWRMSYSLPKSFQINEPKNGRAK